jgi:L-amino acid N-acyltransferase YncA
MLAARGGWLTLPDGIVCLEDSVTAADQRGKGTAPRAWRDLASRLGTEGFQAMITKVAADNAASRKAVLKAGFVEIGVMRYKRRGPTQHVHFEVLGDSATGALLRDRLQR